MSSLAWNETLLVFQVTDEGTGIVVIPIFCTDIPVNHFAVAIQSGDCVQIGGSLPGIPNSLTCSQKAKKTKMEVTDFRSRAPTSGSSPNADFATLNWPLLIV